MVDVDKLSDAELRTKLLEFGFPVMPITGTTRKVMTKKLKILLENKNKAGGADGRRSLGRYSSEEESDTDTKVTKKDRNRRVTMAAPVSSTTSRTSKKVVVEEPEVSSSPRKREVRSSTSTTTRSSRVVKTAQDDFDTGSDSESDIVASSNKYESRSKFDSSSKYDDSFNDVEFNSKISSPVKSTLSSSYSRYSPPKNDELNYSSARSASFVPTPSPARHTAVAGSLASDYAADRLNQIRSRLSLGSPDYNRVTYTSTLESNNDKLDEKETPFLSNFTKRLSALSSTKKIDSERNDLVKEHDTNGSSLYGRSYLSNFRATRGREPTYQYNTKDTNSKSNLISVAVLFGAALFFIALFVMYVQLRSDTSIVSSDSYSPICIPGNPETKIGINCINENDVQNAINLLNSIRPELYKKSVAHKCFDATIKPQMTEVEIITFCQANYGIKDPNMIRHDLRNLEVMIFSNPGWGISVAQTEKNDGAVTAENIAKSMEQVVFNLDHKITSLVILNPELPYRCTIFNTLTEALYTLGLIGSLFVGVYVLNLAFKFYRKYEQSQRNEVNMMVERILEVLQTAINEDSEENYVVINHVRDMILNVKDRKAKQKSWDKAVKYINENESRVRTEVQTVKGEPFEVWRWIGSANLSMSSSPRKSVWQGQAFDTHPGSANSPAYSPTPCLKIRGMLDDAADNVAAAAAREAVLSKVAHRCRILHCQADASSACVYLKCGDAQDAAIAFKNLHGWWYSGQLVTVKYLRLERYQQRFPDAPSGPPYLKSPNPYD